MVMIKRYLKKYNTLGSRRIVDIIEAHEGISIGDRQLRKYAKDMGFIWGRAKVETRLTEEHMKKRLAWAKKHQYDAFNDCVFSDESMVRVGPAPVGERYLRGFRPRHARVAYGGQCHYWWAISKRAQISPFIHSTKVCQKVYLNCLMSHLPRNTRRKIIFQQDNAPCHTAKTVKKWLNSNYPGWYDDWPPNSPDLNPIENLFALIKSNVYARNPQNKEQADLYVMEACAAIDINIINSVIDSMPRRCRAVIDAKGGHTKY
jgi:hypothetical protein